MPVITKITTHVADAKARMVHQFKGKPLLEGLVGALVHPIQHIEDYVHPLTLILDIDTMTDLQLDHIGAIVDQDRLGMADADYRGAIKAKISARLRSGCPDEIIQAFQLLTGSTLATIDYQDDFPAGWVIWGDGTYPSDLVNYLESWSPAGVYCCGLELFCTEAGELLTTEAAEGLYACFHTHGR